MRFGSHACTSLLAGLWVAVLLAPACGSYGGSDYIGVASGSNEIVVGSSLAFSPARLTVPAGTTVRWTNDGPYRHTVTSGASSQAASMPGADFDADLAPGETFERRFDEVGDHPYFCRLHEAMGMKGVITVTAAVPPDAEPPSDVAPGPDPGGYPGY